MAFSKHLIALFLVLASADCPSFANAIDSQANQTTSLEGVWTGNLLQKEWVFEFKVEGGRWSGRYMPPGGVKWHPLTAVVVSARTVSFEMESKPKLGFVLEIDALKSTISGEVTIEGVATVPFSATRKS